MRFIVLLAATLLVVPLPGQAQPAPVVSLTQVPVCGAGPVGGPADLNVEGVVSPVEDPALYRIAAYIYTDAWWTKPTFAMPTVPLTPAGPGAAAFSVDVTTHPNDLEAGYIAVFLIPAGWTPPEASGLLALPAPLFQYPYATAARECDHRVLAFSGRALKIKDSGGARWGPGPNYFSDDPGNVWIDGASNLHLKIDRQNGRWRCAEVVDVSADPAVSSPGYGTYTFQVLSRLDQLDASVVVGLFTWDDDPGASVYAYREIDFEAARWGNPSDPTNAQYVVQPYDLPGHLARFTIPPGDIATTHSFTWQPERVDFRSWYGNSLQPASPGDVFSSYTYQGSDVPPAGGATTRMRMNLWLVGGDAPLNNQPAEVVIRRFDYTPLAPSGVGQPARAWELAGIHDIFPNPSRGAVSFTVSSSTGAKVVVTVADVQGRRVVDLGEAIPWGTKRIHWDGRDEAGRPVTPGVYYVTATIGKRRAATKILIIR